jgi:hypothetical protein
MKQEAGNAIMSLNNETSFALQRAPNGRKRSKKREQPPRTCVNAKNCVWYADEK